MTKNIINFYFLMACYAAVVVVVVQHTCAQLVFPEQSAVFDKTKANANGRVPVSGGLMCGENELYYPGDQENDWICDCAPSTVFHPDTEKCYPVFRKGPCPENETLILAPKKIEPECVPNSCKDGEVPINGECHRLGSQGPCNKTHFFNVLGVNPKTLQIACIELSVDMRIGEPNVYDYDPNKIDLCAVGSKRYQENRCPTTTTTTTTTTTKSPTTRV